MEGDQNGDLDQLFGDLMRCAFDSVEQGPFSVTDKTNEPPSGDKHDYLSMAPYWWPDENSKDGLPYIRKDGLRVPGSVLYGEGAEAADTSRLWSFFGKKQYIC